MLKDFIQSNNIHQ